MVRQSAKIGIIALIFTSIAFGIDMQGERVKNCADPTDAQDAATRQYVLDTAAAAGHNILSAAHGDTTNTGVPTRGSMMIANSTPKWAETVIGAAGTIWRSDGTDPSWAATTNITALGTIATGTWQATDVGVQYGGTGVSTLTDGGILLGSGTGAITALGVASNGQIPIGDGATDPVLATLTGTASEIDITNAAGSITIGLIDPLAVAKGGTGAASLNNLITLTTHTVGNYAAGDGEAGNALTGDTATAFFSAGTIEHEYGGLEADISAIADGDFIVGTGVGTLGLESGNTAIASLGITSTAAELNILDGATLTVTELNYVDGVTSAIQTQFDNLIDGTTAFTAIDADSGAIDGTTIGGTTPAAGTFNALEIINSATTTFYVETTGDTGGAGIVLKENTDDDGGVWVLKAQADETFTIKDGKNEVIRYTIDDSGNHDFAGGDLVRGTGDITGTGKIIFSTTPDTQIFYMPPGADKIILRTAGTNRLEVSSDGVTSDGLITAGAGLNTGGNVDITGTVNTTSDDNWDLNDYTATGDYAAAGYVTVTINATEYRLLAYPAP